MSDGVELEAEAETAEETHTATYLDGLSTPTMTEEEQFKGALYAETSTFPTLYEQVTRDADLHAQIQQYGRTGAFYGASAVGLFIVEILNPPADGVPDVAPLETYPALLSVAGTAVADAGQAHLRADNHTRGDRYRGNHEVALDDLEAVETLLEESEFVSYDNHNTAEMGFYTGPEAADEYGDLLSELQQLYDQGEEGLKTGVDIYGAAFLERHFGEDRAEEIVRELRDGELHQIVRWNETKKDSTGTNPILGDQVFRVEIYAGDSLVATYAGAADTKHAPGRELGERRPDYTDILGELGWTHLRKTDDEKPFSPDFVPVFLRDGVKGTAGVAKDIVYDGPRTAFNWSREQLDDLDLRTAIRQRLR